MTILVTGGGGYIGSHMVLDLLGKNEEVVVVDDLSTGFEWAIHPKTTFYKHDIAHNEAMKSIFKKHNIESIIHFAAKTVVPESVVSPLSYYQNNTMKTRDLLDLAVQYGVKNFVFSSTAAVYGQVNVPLVNEEHIKNPLSPYGSSKLMSEQIIRDVCAASSLKHVILRYFNVAGADPMYRAGQSTANATHLIKVAVQAALGMREGLEIYGETFNTPDGTGVRDYIHVSDLALAHRCALGYLRAGGENLTCNAGYGAGFSVKEVIAAVKEISGVDFKVKTCAARAGDAAAVVADNGRIKSTLNWSPRWNNLTAIVKHAYAWEQHLLARETSIRKAA
jgi:UDP-glucose 4-epimerase